MMSKDDSDRTGAAGAGPAGRRIMKACNETRRRGSHLRASCLRPGVWIPPFGKRVLFFLSADRAFRSVYAPVVPLLRHWTSFGPNREAREAVWASEAAAFGSLPRLSGRCSSRQAGRKRIASR